MKFLWSGFFYKYGQQEVWRIARRNVCMQTSTVGNINCIFVCFFYFIQDRKEYNLFDIKHTKLMVIYKKIHHRKVVFVYSCLACIFITLNCESIYKLSNITWFSLTRVPVIYCIGKGSVICLCWVTTGMPRLQLYTH